MQEVGHLNTIIKSFFPAPDTGHTKQNVFSVQSIFLLNLFRIINIEYIGIDSVMNHMKLIVSEERMLHFFPDPFRDRNNGQLIQG